MKEMIRSGQKQMDGEARQGKISSRIGVLTAMKCKITNVSDPSISDGTRISIMSKNQLDNLKTSKDSPVCPNSFISGSHSFELACPIH
jgi:hypothetical protein